MINNDTNGTNNNNNDDTYNNDTNDNNTNNNNDDDDTNDYAIYSTPCRVYLNKILLRDTEKATQLSSLR